jgi:hypothetical protein
VLRERHRAGVPPAVKNLGGAAHRPRALRAGEPQLIDGGAVQIVGLLAGELRKFGA